MRHALSAQRKKEEAFVAEGFEEQKEGLPHYLLQLATTSSMKFCELCVTAGGLSLDLKKTVLQCTCVFSNDFAVNNESFRPTTQQ